MSEAVQVALIVAVAPVLLGAASIIVALRATKKVDVLHGSVNSKMDELLSLTRQSAHAEGKLEGLAEEAAKHEGVT